MNYNTQEFIKFLLILSLFIFFSFSVLGQTASVVNDANDPRHESINQTEVSVLFDNNLTGSTAVAQWTVRINGVAMPVTGVSILGNRVVVTFNGTTAAGHTASEPFVKPGEVLTISFTNTGNTLTTSGSGNPANSFGFITSKNNFGRSCGELVFFKQENYAAVDVCSPVVMNFTQYLYRLTLRARNSSLFNLGQIFFTVQWGDGGPAQAFNPYLSDNNGVASAAFIDSSVPAAPVVNLALRPTHNYPAANPVDCSFNFSLTPSIQPTPGNCNSIVVATIFPTYDNDNANSGVLNMPPSVANSHRVCLGTNVNMQFSDQTLLNCRFAIEPTVPNDLVRFIRIVYGSQDLAINIPDIRVGGVPVCR